MQHFFKKDPMHDKQFKIRQPPTDLPTVRVLPTDEGAIPDQEEAKMSDTYQTANYFQSDKNSVPSSAAPYRQRQAI